MDTLPPSESITKKSEGNHYQEELTDGQSGKCSKKVFLYSSQFLVLWQQNFPVVLQGF
jgi:hypothetical protein